MTFSTDLHQYFNRALVATLNLAMSDYQVPGTNPTLLPQVFWKAWA